MAGILTSHKNNWYNQICFSIIKLSVWSTHKKNVIIKKMKMPKLSKPMLATMMDKPFDEKGWLYEIKWDGYRAVSYLDNGDVEIKSRNNKSFNEKFYPLYNALKNGTLMP